MAGEIIYLFIGYMCVKVKRGQRDNRNYIIPPRKKERKKLYYYDK